MNGHKRKVHFVGVGGIGMSGLAEILLNLDYPVSGSDLRRSPITDRLARLGLSFYEGHAAEQVNDADVLVVSAAVPDDNVEVVAARERGIPVWHRSTLLADLMRLKPQAIAVGGTHGKTTTTSMVSAILDKADIGATSIIGGILHRSGTNALWGRGDILVAEADEHDGSFLRLSPTISVVTSIDAEHLEYYGTIDRIKRAFTEFCNQVPFYGYSVICYDDPHVREIYDQIESICIPYGLEPDEGPVPEALSLMARKIRVENLEGSPPGVAELAQARTVFEVVCRDARLADTGVLGTVAIRALGMHNVRNALAACAVGLCLGMPFSQVAEGLLLYDGVRRRMQVHGTVNGVTVVEDYAHHPTEIASTLEAVRWTRPSRILCVFQPHLYSRTRFFCEEFARVLASVDYTIVTDIYPSREQPLPGVDAGIIVDAAQEQGANHVVLVGDMDDACRQVGDQARPGDVILILGAGNINRIAEPLLERLREGEKEKS